MNLDEIKKLIKIFERSKIGELEIVEENHKIKMTKTNQTIHNSPNVNGGSTTYILPPSQIQDENAIEHPPNQKGTNNIESLAGESSNDYYEVRAPMVGTFYRTPSPDADPYANVGDSIAKGQTLCIIEAMKLMNEIQSDFDGKIVKILVENAQPVEYNQVLFLLDNK